jgi:hypothetical protein
MIVSDLLSEYDIKEILVSSSANRIRCINPRSIPEQSQADQLTDEKS